MSKVKLKHASGNSMSIAAPATNPASDLELKLPSTVGSSNQFLKNSGTAGTLEYSNNLTFDGNKLFHTPAATSTADGFHITPAGGTTASSFYVLGNSSSGAASGRNGGVTAIDANYYADTSTIFSVSGRGASRFAILGVGHVLFNCTSFPSDSVAGAGFEKNGAQAILRSSSGSSTGSSNHFELYNGNGMVGRINTNGSATTFHTSSDYRLKENQVAISDGITRLKSLKPYRFNFKVDPTKTVDGFFAHEVSPAVPEAIGGEKDAVNEDGSINPQGIDHSKLVPLLTAALQEAIAKIEVLETKVAALEAA